MQSTSDTTDITLPMQLEKIPLLYSKTLPAPPGGRGPRTAPCPGTPAPTGHDGAIIERNGFAVHLAETPGHHRQARVLVDRMYAWRGYRRENTPPAVCDFLQSAHARPPARTTLLACRGTQALGTLTLNIDNGGGLLADHLYRREIDTYRQGGKRVCELTGFAVDQRTGSKELLAALFHLLYIAGRRLYRVSDVFIEVNPRHVAFYRSQLGFRQAGESRMCERVEAPATLLHAGIDFIEAQIARLAGKRELSRRSLYPYFFTGPEEEEFGRRLLAAKAQGHRREAGRPDGLLISRPGAAHQPPASARLAVPA